LVSIGGINVAPLEGLALQMANRGQIDGLGNLTNHNLYIFSGLLDTIIWQAVVQSTEKMARDLLVKNIKVEYSIAAEHSWPTLDYGQVCWLLAPPFINNCDYDTAGVMLNHIYGQL